jgi:phosphonate transport system permease protein
MTKLSRIWRTTLTVLIIALVVAAYGISARVTQLDFFRLFTDASKAKQVLLAFLSPDLFTHDTKTTNIAISFPIPCGSAPQETALTSGPRLVPNVHCASPKATFKLEGFQLAPNADIAISWKFPDGRLFTVDHATTDSKGHFLIEMDAKSIAASSNGVASKLQVETSIPVGSLLPSQAFKDVFQNIMVTIFMALLSTTVATIVAAPLSFLAASNIIKRGCFGTAIYYITRSSFNLLRSYDPLVMVIIFGFWVGFGPFPGVLALTVVTIASLGKMFSEAVESIDPGPIEALNATGANRIQTIVFSVIPQIVPDFISYIIYHWDINVRISTIIGFVGGGGIGYYLNQRINLLDYHKAGTAIWAIVIVVWAMDFLSAEVRKRLT